MKRAIFVFAALGLLMPNIFGQDRGLSVIAKQVTGSDAFDIGRQYAVIIGIDKYQEWPSLKSAVAEAKEVRGVLAERYYIDEFMELYDQAATASGIRRLFAEELPKKLGIRDSLFVFYAGHGYLDSSKTGFWIASDGVRDVFDQKGWLPNAQLRNFIAQLKAQRILVVADACFSGDFLNVNRGAMPVIDSAYFKRALQLTARQIITSGASETVPDESEFGRQFINLLSRNNEPLLDPIAIYDRIRLGVTQTEPLLGSIPGHEQGAAFVLFLKPSGGAPALKAEPAPVRTVPEGKGLVKVRWPEAQKGKSEILVKSADANSPESTQVLGDTLLEPGAWIFEAKLSDDLEPTFRKEVKIPEGATLTIDIPVLSYSKPFQIKGLRTEFNGLEIKLVEGAETQKTKDMIGWISMGIGAIGLGTAAYFYLDGVDAHADYLGAALSQEAIKQWDRIIFDSTLFAASASIAGVSLTATPLLFFTSPLPGIKRRMDDILLRIESLNK